MDRGVTCEALVPDRQPGPVRRGDVAAGGRPVPGDLRRPRPVAALRGRVEARADRRGGHPQGVPRGQRRRGLRRPDRVDAHLLTGQDVDRRAGRAAQAAAAPAHPGQQGTAVELHRHGLHEPQPGRARRPRVRLHPVQARRAAQDRGGARERPGGGGARRRLGTGRGGTRRGGLAQGGEVRRQHARRRGHRGGQGRGAAAVRRLGQHLRRQRPGRRGRGGLRRGGDHAGQGVRGRLSRRPGAAGGR